MEWNREGGNLKWIAGKTSWHYDLWDSADAPSGDKELHSLGNLKQN